MEENSKQEPLKKDKKIIKEEKRVSLFSNNKKEITKEEYDHRAKNCIFFMRSPLSNQIILQIRDDSKKRKKSKKVSFIYKSNQKQKTINQFLHEKPGTNHYKILI